MAGTSVADDTVGTHSLSPTVAAEELLVAFKSGSDTGPYLETLAAERKNRDAS
jgi:hypothetical protein